MTAISMSMILIALLTIKRIWLATFQRRFTVSGSKSQIKDILLHLFNNFLQLRRTILNNSLVLLYLRNHLRILLQLLSKSHSLLQILQPFLSSLLVFTSIQLLIWLLNYEVKELFLHVKGHIAFINHFHAVQTIQRSNLFRLLRIICSILISNQRTLKRIDQYVSFLQTHKRSLGL